ncbi:50S ribosomal protein L25/general stress protein Ctc [Tenacibaculum retecalamus]|uniref:50S ribosomal protein L25/general stress protein Ctc n=1 Tax=Tenacibaculum retecalamus TaxID=3018315 RepID=UPI0023D96898|nr:50S ribosomal protein L25/general stress protein Ctc [Tenacibaculum retecalamus]WBX71283.1 50S ribosomal protein L25/general stress protein Ctc [Tenacibaculum retecalamus]
MKSITINGSQRESVGKKATKALRNAGQVPCVLYGGKEAVHFSAEEKSFKPLVFTPDVFTATIEINGTKYSAVLQDIQFHPVTDRILHVDFYQIFEDKELTMEIPVRLTGTAKGITLGGALRHNLRKLRVKALPANLPDFIEADVTRLEIGNKLYVTELKNDNYSLLHPDNTVVAQVRMSRNAAKAAAESTDDATAEA